MQRTGHDLDRHLATLHLLCKAFLLIFCFLVFNRMLMPKRHRALIYEYLFKEGVLVAMKDTHLAKHPEIDVPNLHVMKALQVCSIIPILV